MGKEIDRLAATMPSADAAAPDPTQLQACLPAELRGPNTTLTRVAAGLSGAGVYRVDAAGQAYVLKLGDGCKPLASWRRTLQVLERAAAAGVAPRVVHVDEARRAVLSELVVDRSFFAFYGPPHTRAAALQQLGQTLRRVHDLALPADGGDEPWEPRALLAELWSSLAGSLALPPFVGAAVERVLSEEPPARERAPVLCHNDLNPSNLIFDGERLLLLDWETAAPNDPFFDLAAVSVFFRMDEATCRQLLAAYDGAPAAGLPARFAYSRRLAAALCGALFLYLARQSGHAGARGDETLESTPALEQFYQRMRAGEWSLASPEGWWRFALALIKTSAEL